MLLPGFDLQRQPPPPHPVFLLQHPLHEGSSGKPEKTFQIPVFIGLFTFFITFQATSECYLEKSVVVVSGPHTILQRWGGFKDGEHLPQNTASRSLVEGKGSQRENLNKRGTSRHLKSLLHCVCCSGRWIEGTANRKATPQSGTPEPSVGQDRPAVGQLGVWWPRRAGCWPSVTTCSGHIEGAW